MSLQNKKIQLLNRDDNDASADVDDIFAQYGSGDDDQSDDQPTSAPAPQQSSTQAVRDDLPVVDSAPEEKVVAEQHATVEAAAKEAHEKSKEIEDAIVKMNAGVPVEKPDQKTEGDLPPKDIFEQNVPEAKEEAAAPSPAPQQEEKKWEKDFEENGTIAPPPVVDKPKADVPQKKEVEETAPPVPQKKEVKEQAQPAPKKEASKEKAQPVVEEKKEASKLAPVKANHNAVVQSEVKKGVKKSRQKKAPEEKRGVHIDPAKKTIVIVDDDIDTLGMYADVFENADYNVIRAHDGLDAMNAIGHHTPHVIFTGIVMPRMDGFAMMETLKQNKRTADIPVVINSHLGRESDKKRAEELGAKDFIVRGFTPPREVVERIGALLLRNEYVFRFDHNDPEAKKLIRDLGANNFFVCPRGQEMVIKLSVEDPKDLTFSARFSCVDEKKDK